MKPSHLTTPRTLNECVFMTGYRCASMPRRNHWGHAFITVMVCAGIGIILAWRG